MTCTGIKVSVHTFIIRDVERFKISYVILARLHWIEQFL